MATGACGINCDTCRLHRCGACSSCGGGMSGLGIMKLDTQKRLLGAPCTILACARLNRIDYCLADCDAFPCENFSSSHYPFGDGFLQMQKRRREEFMKEQNKQHDVLIPAQHWQTVRERNSNELQQAAGASITDEGHLCLTVLEQTIRVNLDTERVEKRFESKWLPTSRLLAFVTVVYLASASSSPLAGRWVTEKDLSCASFFRGFHRLPVSQLMDRFGADPKSLINAAEQLGGFVTNDPGDAAVRLWVFPHVPVKVSLWRRDEELPAGVGIMFDQSIEDYLPADGIWAMVHLLSDTLVEMA